MRYVFIFIVYFLVLSYIILFTDKEKNHSFGEVLMFNMVGHLIVVLFSVIIFIFYNFW